MYTAYIFEDGAWQIMTQRDNQKRVEEIAIKEKRTFPDTRYAYDNEQGELVEVEFA